MMSTARKNQTKNWHLCYRTVNFQETLSAAVARWLLSGFVAFENSKNAGCH